MVSKRGLSTVVATVLLLLITVTAFFVVAKFIIPFVKTSLYGSTACTSFDVPQYFSFKETIETVDGTYRYNCYNSTNNRTAISFEAANIPDDKSSKVIGFGLVLDNGGQSISFIATNGTSPSCAVGGIKHLGDSLCTKKITVPSARSTSTYVYYGDKVFEKVKVFPILADGKYCKADEIKLIECTVGI